VARRAHERRHAWHDLQIGVAQPGITGAAGAVELALALWIGFPVVLLVGSITQENVPWRLAAIHAGDWLAKLLIVAVLAAIWQ